MKKIVILCLLLIATTQMNAQIMRAEQLEEYAEKLYGNKWTDIAANLLQESTITLDKNNALTYIQVIEAPNRSITQLYTTLNYWFTSTFNDANSTIKLNDKESGCIIAQAFVEGIATHTGGSNKYNVSIKPTIRVDIKEGKCRVTYSIQAYNVLKSKGGGILGAVAAGMSGVPNKTADVEEVWPLDQTYPFAEKDAFGAKKTSSKAAVMTYCYSQVVLDKIEEAIKNGMVGEDEDW